MHAMLTGATMGVRRRGRATMGTRVIGSDYSEYGFAKPPKRQFANLPASIQSECRCGLAW